MLTTMQTYANQVTGPFPLESRFARFVSRGDRCWEWTGGKSHSGYGQFKVADRTRRATHVAWFLGMGRWPPAGMMVCHHCDNPGCVRPEHLFLGTAKDNVTDCKRKGRRGAVISREMQMAGALATTGEKHWCAKLTDDIVRRIRARLAAGEMQWVLAAEYGVTQSKISDVWRRKTWRHVV